MGSDFNEAEIFEVAIQIEKNGADFYRRMIEKISDDPLHKMLEDLALMEESHEKIFKSMREDLSDPERETTTIDPAGDVALYLKAMADLHIFDNEMEDEFTFPDYLSEEAKLRKILRSAINLEWGSISLYLGMKDLVPEGPRKEKIDGILKEEMRHVRLLSNALKSLKQRTS